MTVLLDRRNAPEPNVSAVRADAVGGVEQTRYAEEDVLLAVEVVSPVSEARDRDARPREYAAAGIPHFWLVEMSGADEHPVVRRPRSAVRGYELDPVNHPYARTGIHHGQLKVSVPSTSESTSPWTRSARCEPRARLTGRFRDRLP